MSVAASASPSGVAEPEVARVARTRGCTVETVVAHLPVASPLHQDQPPRRYLRKRIVKRCETRSTRLATPTATHHTPHGAAASAAVRPITDQPGAVCMVPLPVHTHEGAACDMRVLVHAGSETDSTPPRSRHAAPAAASTTPYHGRAPL